MKVAIVGGTAAGLIAGYELQARGFTVEIFESKEVGFDVFESPQVVKQTDRFEDFLKSIDVPYSLFRYHVGILVRGNVRPYLELTKILGKTAAEKARFDLYCKTRLVEPEADRLEPMPSTRTCLRFDWHGLIRSLKLLMTVRKEHVQEIGEDYLVTHFARHKFDRAIITLPLWKTQQVATWNVPDALSVVVNSAIVRPRRLDQFASWDSVWTPYTPEGLVHRVHQVEDTYHVHFSGVWDEEANTRLTGDLNFLFPGGWVVAGSYRDLPGFMFDLGEEPSWPQNIRPLGCFSEWNPKLTLDETLEKVLRFRRAWGMYA